MSHEEWEATHDDHEGCSTRGESAVNEHDGRNRWDPEHPPNWGQHSHEDDIPDKLGEPNPPFTPTNQPVDFDDIYRWLRHLKDTGIYGWKPLEGEPIPPTTEESAQPPTDAQLVEDGVPFAPAPPPDWEMPTDWEDDTDLWDEIWQQCRFGDFACIIMMIIIHRIPYHLYIIEKILIMLKKLFMS